MGALGTLSLQLQPQERSRGWWAFIPTFHAIASFMITCQKTHLGILHNLLARREASQSSVFPRTERLRGRNGGKAFFFPSSPLSWGRP